GAWPMAGAAAPNKPPTNAALPFRNSLRADRFEPMGLSLECAENRVREAYARLARIVKIIGMIGRSVNFSGGKQGCRGASRYGIPGPAVGTRLNQTLDWSFLQDAAKRVDPYDRLRFIPLNDPGTIYVTLDLENHTEFQYLNSNDWGAGPQDHTGYVLERLMPDVDVRLHDPHPGWDVIIGRQEIVVGTGRLIDDNEGVNVRNAFNGVRVGYDKPK